MSILISIITVNLNNKNGLLKTIKSIKSQTFKDFELIVVDGNSTDGSKDVLSKNANIINHLICENDTGIYNAMNKGINLSTGKYLLFLNSGDWLVDINVFYEASKYLDKEIDIIYGNLITIRENERKIMNFPDEIRVSYLYSGYLPHPSSFIKKSLFSKIGSYSEDYKICSDWEFILKAIIINNCTYLHIPIVISIFPLNGISSKQYNIVLKERNDIIQKLLPYLEEDLIELNLLRENTKSRLVKFAIKISNNKILFLIKNRLSKFL